MGRSKGSKRKTKEMVVGSDVDDSDQEETVETAAPPAASATAIAAAPSAEGAAAGSDKSESESEEEQAAAKKASKKPIPAKKAGGKKAPPAEAAKKGAPASAPSPKAKHSDPAKAGEDAAGGSDSGSDSSSSESDAESDAESTDDEAARRPRVVQYCPVCTFQAEMCEFSGMLEKCKPWLMEHLKEEEARLIAEGGEKGRKRKGVYAEGEGPAPGAKLKKKPDQCVLVQVKKRSGKKVVTIIQGLDFYGVNLKDITRDFKKRFCCGCGIVETPGELDAVEVQGDVAAQLAEMLPKQYKIPVNEIFKKEGKEKSLLCTPE